MGIPILIITSYAYRTFNTFYEKQTAEEIRIRAILIGSQLEEHIAHSSGQQGIDSLCKALAKETSTRFTVISPTGKVIGDSEKNPDSMENHSNRPEVVSALSGETGIADRFSYTLQKPMMYAAVPVYKDGRIAVVVRTAIPITSIKTALSTLFSPIMLAVGFMALLAALISFRISRNVSRPIETMKRGAQRFAAGDFSIRLPLSGNEETNLLAKALNEMAHTLNGTFSTITEQHTELDAILSSMTEGVIAVDGNEKIIMLNNAAAKLFNIDQHQAPGKWIGEAVRNVAIRAFLLKTLDAHGYIEGETIIFSSSTTSQFPDTERFLQLHGSPLSTASGKSIGALMVINDISQIKKLENMRKEFVANVSHELRTPLTSIKGFTETLVSGTMHTAEQTKRFLTIINGQVDRLTKIVEDLLSLSRIERDFEHNSIDLANDSICQVLRSAIETCTPKADEKHIGIECECDPGLTANIDRTLLELAVVNLIDNAINYSDPYKHIQVKAALDLPHGEVAISIQDEGIGIAPEHHERLFERFYRVDKARSRKLGGTGLGLAIVKHIVLAHGGHVGVESAPGSGSTFYMRVPWQAGQQE